MWKGILTMSSFKKILTAFLISSMLIISFTSGYAEKKRSKAMEKYYAANALFNKDLFELAQKEYKNFLLKYPEHKKADNAKFGLSLSYFKQEKYSKARPLLEELSEKSDVAHQEQIHNLLGQCYLMANKPQKAEAAFRWSVNHGKEQLYVELPGMSKGAEKSPQISLANLQNLDPLERSLAGLVESLFQQQKWSQVVKYKNQLDKLVPKSNYSDRVKLLAAISLYKMNNYSQAEKILNRLVKKGDKLPYYEHALFLLADCQQLQGKLNKALDKHKEIATEMQGSFTSNSLFRMGYIKFLKEDYKGAEKAFSELRTIYPKSEYYDQAGIFLGRALLEQEKYTKAQSVFGNLTDQPDVSAEATLWLAKTFNRQSKYDKALKVLKTGKEEFKDNPKLKSILFDYANTLMAKENYKKAAKYFTKLYKEYPKEDFAEDSCRLAAFCYNRAGQYKESMKVCNVFIDKYSSSDFLIDVKFIRAEDLFFTDQIKKAIKAYKTFIPWEGEADYKEQGRFRLAQCYSEQEQWKKAKNQIRILLNKNVEGSFYQQLYYLAGLSEYKLENWSSAIDYFNNYIDEYPDSSNLRSALVKLSASYINVENYEKAVKSFKKLVNNFPDSKYTPYALTELGRCNYLLENYKEAKKYFEKVINNYSDTRYEPQAEYYLGWIELEFNNRNKALEHFAVINKKYPKNELAPDALYQQAIYFIKQNNYKVVEEKLQKFLDAYPDNSKKESALFYYILAKSHQEKYNDQKDIFKEFINKYPDSKFIPRVLYESAWRAKRLGRLDTARSKYKELIENYPEKNMTKNALMELAELEYQEDNYSDSIKYLDRLRSKDISKSLKARLLYRLGWCFLGRGQNESAAKTFQRLINNHPNKGFTQVAAYQIGEIALENNDYDKAYKYFQESIDAKRQDKEVEQQAYIRLGETATMLNKWEKAQSVYEKLLEKYPDSEYAPRATMMIGWTYENKKDFDKAIKLYRKAIKLDNDTEVSSRSQFQIGECYFAQQEYNKAIKAFTQVEVQFPNKEWTPRALLELGQAMIKINKRKEANKQFEKILSDYPGTDEAVTAEKLIKSNKEHLDE